MAITINLIVKMRIEIKWSMQLLILHQMRYLLISDYWSVFLVFLHFRILKMLNQAIEALETGVC